MATRNQIITELYGDMSIKVTQTAEEWTAFLRSACRNYKCRFDEQLLIYAQRPDAIAVLELPQWNRRFGRWVSRGAKSIAVFNETPKGQSELKHYFDISDTQPSLNSKSVTIWDMQNHYHTPIIEALIARFDLQPKDITLFEAIRDSVQKTTLENIHHYYQDSDQRITHDLLSQLIWNSVIYMVLTRSGYDAEQYLARDAFEKISMFTTKDHVNTLGVATSELAEAVLKEISVVIAKIINREKASNRTFVQSDNTMYHENTQSERERTNNYERDNLFTSGRLPNPQPLFAPESKDDSGTGEIRTTTSNIPQEKQTRPVHQPSDISNIGVPFEGDRQVSATTIRSHSESNDEGTGHYREHESPEPDALGRIDEQHQAVSRGGHPDRTDLQLERFPTVQEQQEMIKAEALPPSAFTISQEYIDLILQRGSNFSDGKYRIQEQFLKKLSEKENALFLKKEYGTGGAYPAISSHGLDEWHDGRGIKITHGPITNPDAFIQLSWAKVSKRVSELIRLDRYLNRKEKDYYPYYLAKMQEPETNASALVEAKDSLPASTELTAEYDFEYHLGDIVYLGITEYEILSLDETVTLSDTHYPLLYQKMDFTIFDKRVRENPANIHLKTKSITNIKEYSKINSLDSDKKMDETYFEVLGEVEIGKDDPYYVLAIQINEIRKEIDPDRYIPDTSAESDAVDLLGLEIKKSECVTKIIKELNDYIGTLDPQNHRIKHVQEVIKNLLELTPIHQLITSSIPEKKQFQLSESSIGIGGPKERFMLNMTAIHTLKTCESENRLATPEEQALLAKYVGWGGLSQAFDDQNQSWSKECLELKDSLTDLEYIAARESTLTSFYTHPVVIKAMYNVLENLGFQAGNILEPSCGIGNFLGMLPESMSDSKTYGVELDSVSGRLAKQLYPKSKIAIEGFEKTNLPDSFFDAVLGNVPFGEFKVMDQRYDKHNFLIHDYFFAKALDKVRPGGIVAFITSQGTMDKKTDSSRKYIAQRAVLLGAIRLPDNTFKSSAGTEVTSDILFLQKRESMIHEFPDWVYLNKDKNGLKINSYFVSNPQMILGEMVMESSQYGFKTVCKPHINKSLEEQLTDVIAYIHGSVSSHDLSEMSADLESSIPADLDVKNFSYTLVDGDLYYRENSKMTQVDISKTAEDKIRSFIKLRDCTRLLLQYQMENFPDTDIKRMQTELNTLYDQFAKQYGLINNRTNAKTLSEDSGYFLLCSLEILDDEGNLERKADLFTKRTIKAHAPVTHVDTASEALAMSIAEKACVDMEYMSKLSKKSTDELVDDLSGVIFRVPFIGDGSNPIYQTADEYLSGNVKDKLRQAQNALQTSSIYQGNVDALTVAQPKDLIASEISVRLGATWIPSNIIAEFMFELLQTSNYCKHHIRLHYFKLSAEWSIENKKYDRTNITATSTYGTSRINAYGIIEETLNLKNVRIFDYVEDDNRKKKPVLNKKETTLAQAKQDLIKEKFVDWLWKDPQRRDQLTRLYNDLFNNTRPREYDGKHIVFRGINPEIALKTHQVNAIAHILYGGNTLLAHVVGAGKTFEMVAAAQESKRLGLCSKSMFVVPNHIVGQIACEYLQLYPSANILVATKKDFETKNRKKFCSRIATGDYDAVIIGHSQFEKIPMSQERQSLYFRNQINEIVSSIEELKSSRGERFAIKQMELLKKRVEAKLTKLSDQSRKDNVVTFEELGVDKLFIDESHNYKNLYLFTKMTNVSGISSSEAQKSNDLYMKCRYLDELTGGRGVVFATGTPISNSMVELYTIQRYLQYDRLSQSNLEHFDAWASTFGETTTAIELSPEGTGYRAKTRFAKFYNLPELMIMFKEVADIQTADMINLPVPQVTYHNISVKPSPLQIEMVKSLSQRADRVRSKTVDSKVDNMLKITSDGRKLALDQRLMNDNLPDFEGSKVNTCVKDIFELWKKNEDQKLTQLVFCDLSTPKSNGFSVYSDMKAKLIETGIPDREVQFIHTANNEIKKKELFAKVRSGDVRVLIGSTSKMGAGTNVQDKLIGLHNLDCPWRPSDLEQRRGRIVRQGNQNPCVEIFNYVTEQTFDAYLYQLVENKQRFISQIMTSKSPIRTAEDVDEAALSYAEIKMLATGNPRIKEKMDLDMHVARLRLLKQSHLSEKYRLEDKLLKDFPRQIKHDEERIKGLRLDLQELAKYPSNSDFFSPMIIYGQTFTQKKEAGEALLEACKTITNSTPISIGNYRGFGMELLFDIAIKEFQMILQKNLGYKLTLGKDAHGNITRIDNALSGLCEQLKVTENHLQDTKNQIASAKLEAENSFSFETELQDKTARLNELNALLNLDEKDSESIDDTPNLDEEKEKVKTANVLER